MGVVGLILVFQWVNIQEVLEVFQGLGLYSVIREKQSNNVSHIFRFYLDEDDEKV